jgi:phosphate transport system permease protein
MELYTKRRIRNLVWLSASVIATLFGLFWLVWLLWTLISNGLQWVSLDLFTKTTPPPGSKADWPTPSSVP